MKATRSNSLKSDESRPATIGDIKEMLNCFKDEILASVKDDLCRIENRLESLDSRIVNLEHMFEFTKRRQELQQLDINDLKLSLSRIECSNKPTEILREVEDRDSRRNNVILFGLPENDHATALDRVTDDKKHTKELFLSLGFDDIKVCDISRLGKKIESKIRPVKVTLENPALKKLVIQKARQLRNNEKYKNIYIDYDKTKLQQSEWNNLRSELKQRRESGEDVVIYNGCIRPRASLKHFR